MKKCILCDKENSNIFFEICIICWLKINEKTPLKFMESIKK